MISNETLLNLIYKIDLTVTPKRFHESEKTKMAQNEADFR